MDDGRALVTLLGSVRAEFVGDPGIAVTDVVYDSRSASSGCMFVAVPGFVHDGARFVPNAISAGARAIVAEVAAPADLDPGITWARVESARRALATAACAWFGSPSDSLQVVGVTGTNGKTSVTALLEEIFGRRSKVGRWSTTRVRIAGRSQPVARTTPESVELQESLARMLRAGCETAVIEVSSHALALDRVHGTRFRGAAFTNLSVDHLDFHADMHDYRNAKGRLFEALDEDAPGVINTDDAAAAYLARHCRGRVVGYGWSDQPGREVPCTYRILEYASSGEGTRLRLDTPGGPLALTTPLFGRANAENVTAAVALGLELGVDTVDVTAAVAAFAGEEGRLERIDRGQPFTVLVDYAHTPGALEAALEAARAIRPVGRLIVVFGCGGDRDRGKRPEMGRIAATDADIVIVTSDNPRSEDPEKIIADVLAGVPADAAEPIVEPDRRAAINAALNAAATGDCVLIAGKGHETEQVFADETIEFDDRRVTAELLQTTGAATRSADR